MNQPILQIDPYIVGKPVPPDQFYGYASHIKDFYRALLGPVMQPVRILGLRRSGKTSFLRYLSSTQREITNFGAMQHRSLSFVYIDLQRIQNPAQFYYYVITEIRKKLPSFARPFPVDPILNGYIFESWIEEFVNFLGNISLVIILDEFDKLVSNEEFEIDFFRLLRAMASSSDYASKFTWVTASVQDVHALSHKNDIDKISYFWNIFLFPIILGGFTKDESRELIRIPASHNDVIFSKREIEEIYRISGRLPYFIQAVSREWYLAKIRKLPFKKIKNQTIENLLNLEQINNLFAGYWNWMTREQQTFMYSLAYSGSPVVPISKQGCSHICDFGLVDKTPDGYQISGELIRQFIADQQPPKDNYINSNNDSSDNQRDIKITTQSTPTKHHENVAFVSYAWGDESEHVVHELEQAFANRNIRIVRDKKDLGYKSSIEAFEQSIGLGRFIILIISDKYLRSEHCMYELVEVGENQSIRERIFPIVLADALIYKATDRLNYINYWDKQIDQLNQAIKQVGVITNLAGITADLDKYARIRANLDHLTDLLSDMNTLTPDTHTASGFSALINSIESAINKKR